MIKLIMEKSVKTNYNISVIIGIYNCKNTIEEALNSLLNQTYQNFNIIICDDGSQDNSYEIVENIAREHSSKFILLRNSENMGLNYTLNRCLEHAKGKYIARMDGDDISMPNRFEIQLDKFKELVGTDIVSSSMVFFDEEGDYGKSYPIEVPTKRDFLKETALFSHAAAMMTREAIISVNGYTEDKRLLRVEDYNLWTKMYSKGFKGYNIQYPLYKMRNDDHAISRRKYKYRINEFHAKNIAVKSLNLPKWTYLYSIIPLVKGLVPRKTYKFIYRIVNR